MALTGSDEQETAIRAAVRGRVQGVFFRETTKRRALEVGAKGWVRNQDDGTVLVHAEGPRDAVDKLVDFLHEGPPSALVEDVEVRPVKVEGHEQFAVRGVPAGVFTVWAETGDQGSRYLLTLEVGASVRTWELRKEPSMDPAVKRMAIEKTDAGGGDGEAVGAGNAASGGTKSGDRDEAVVWDQGPYEQGGRVPWPEAIDGRGHAVFVLHGEKLRGGFALQRTGPGRWLLIKRRE